MRVSLNSLQYHSNVTLLPKGGVDELVQKIGAQLGAVETVEHWGSRYEGVVVAKVMKCDKHPNADKLSVCTIDDGGVTKDVERQDDLVQVVCGAPNIAAGQTIAWIPPGATVPSTYATDDPFVLEARELRGVVSNGMIASPAELGISDDHEGILVINPAEVREELSEPGTPFKKLYGLDDVVIDIENKMFTHRPDCFGVLGVAREIAGIQRLVFKSPQWYLEHKDFNEVNNLPLTIKNELPELVPRFMAVAMSNVEVKPSPLWVQALLTRVGLKPINNVVDITNYLSYITAQPLHAYDYDKVKALSAGEPSLIIRYPKDGEKVALLNGKTTESRKEAIMISTDKELVGIGGVMGGTSTEVDENTKNIILECASFDMYSIRRTSMEHGLFTDAATRFTKGQSPLQNDRVLAHALQLVSDQAGGQQASGVVDDHPLLTENPVIQVTADFINARLGTSVTIDEISTLLRNVEFEVSTGEHIKVKAPFWRTDISIPEDIVEEVGRLLGFDELPLELPKRTVTPTILDQKLTTKKRVRAALARFGANEVLTYSFVHGDLIKKSAQDEAQAFKLSNALSPDLQYYRLSLTPSLLAHVHQNIKAGHEHFSLFEIGKCHNKTLLDDEKVPMEFDRVALVLAAKSSRIPAYFEAQKYVRELLGNGFALAQFDAELYDDHQHIGQMTAPYEPNRSALVIAQEGHVIGIVGEYKMSVISAFKLPEHSAGFELFLSAFKTKQDDNYVPLSRFPGTSGDITIEVSTDLPYGDLVPSLESSINKHVGTDQYADIELIDIYTDESIAGKKRYTFHIVLTSYSHTLTDAALTTLFDKSVEDLSKTIPARRI